MYNEIIKNFVKQQEDSDEVVFLRDIQDVLKITDAELIDIIDDAISSVVIEIRIIKKGEEKESKK